MTTAVAVPQMRSALHRTWVDSAPVERAAYVIAALLVASGLVHLGVLAVSGGSWEGPLSYRKAATFGLSFGLTLATVTWATSFVRLRPAARAGLLATFTAASVMETALVTMQVWRGVPSHFNFETGFDTGISMTLAAGGGVIIVTVLAFTAAAVRTPGPPGMTLALRYGFVVLLIALAVGAVMIGRGVSLARGGEPQLAYATAGALKPLHAVTMHAIIVLPGLAWLLTFTSADEHRQRRVVRVAAVTYTLAIVAAASLSGLL